LVGLLNDLAAPIEILAMQLTDVKDELGEMHSGTNFFIAIYI
jgi:hypothetical protein